MLVGLCTARAVFVADGMVVGVAEARRVRVGAGTGVPVTKMAPGVRKTSHQAGRVKMAELTGPMGPFDPPAAKALFGSRWESILAASCQLGANRSASCPATITHRNPITRMTVTMIQSGRSGSNAFIARSAGRQPHKDRRPGVIRFVMARAFQPDAPVMGIDDAACDRQSQTRTSPFEFCLARGM